MMKATISAQDLRHSYGEGALKTEILHGLDFQINAGEVTLLVGPSGSGKSTLLTLVGALRSVQTGSLKVLGTELNGTSEQARTELRRRIGFIFQSHNLVPSLTVLQNVTLLLQLKDLSPAEREGKAKELLEAVGLSHRLQNYPDHRFFGVDQESLYIEDQVLEIFHSVVLQFLKHRANQLFPLVIF